MECMANNLSYYRKDTANHVFTLLGGFILTYLRQRRCNGKG